MRQSIFLNRKQLFNYLPIKPAMVGEAPISRACFEIRGIVMLTPNRSYKYATHKTLHKNLNMQLPRYIKRFACECVCTCMHSAHTMIASHFLHQIGHGHRRKKRATVKMPIAKNGSDAVAKKWFKNRSIMSSSGAKLARMINYIVLMTIIKMC